MRGDLVDGRYELLDVIASGGMATVWRALDTRLDRIVALKQPHPTPPGDPGPKRLTREAKTAALLSHPNLISIYDAGDDDGHPYLVMELVEGPTLATTRDLAPGEAIAIGGQLADALAAIHGARIIHRDIKPANIILSERGPQLTDFGIALSFDPTAPLTEPGSVIATPSYAAPEVLAGAEPTAAADVFSLAAVIYELVAGRAPFEGVDRSEPPPLGDPAIDTILRECLSPDPTDRPTAGRLVDRLRGEVPTVAAPVPTGSTQVLPVPVTASMDDPVPYSHPGTRKVASRTLVLAGGGFVAVAAIALVVSALIDSSGTPSLDSIAVETTASVATVPSTMAATSPPPTLPTTSGSAIENTSEALAEVREEVDETREEVIEAVEEFHPSSLSPSDAREILTLVDQAVAAAEAGEGEESAESLAAAYRKARDSIRRESSGDLLEALEELAHALDDLLLVTR